MAEPPRQSSRSGCDIGRYVTGPALSNLLTDVCAGEAVIAKLRKMRTIDEDENDDTLASGATIARSSWMTGLERQSEEWLSTLPQSLSAPLTESSPSSRFFGRESAAGDSLLQRVRNDLDEVIRVCKGLGKQTNELRALLKDLSQGEFAIDRLFDADKR